MLGLKPPPGMALGAYPINAAHWGPWQYANTGRTRRLSKWGGGHFSPLNGLAENGDTAFAAIERSSSLAAEVYVGTGSTPVWAASEVGTVLQLRNEPLNSGTSSHLRWKHSSSAVPYEGLLVDETQEATIACVYKHVPNGGTINNTFVTCQNWGTGAGGEPDGTKMQLTYSTSPTPAIVAFFQMTEQPTVFILYILSAAQESQIASEFVPLALTWNGSTATLYFDGVSGATQAMVGTLDSFDWVTTGRQDLKEQEGPSCDMAQLIVTATEWAPSQVVEWTQDPFAWMWPYPVIASIESPVVPFGPFRHCTDALVPGAEQVGDLRAAAWL